MAIHDVAENRCLELVAALNAHRSTVPSAQDFCVKTPEMTRNELEVKVGNLREDQHIFSPLPFYVTKRQALLMSETIRAIEFVISLPEYQELVSSWAPGVTKYAPGPIGVFFSYDFHLGQGIPKLIEINTNAGGCLLSLAGPSFPTLHQHGSAHLEAGEEPATIKNRIWNMFLEEWRRQRGEMPLRTIAIVDTAPESQFLFSEFQLFAELFRSYGVTSFIVDPTELDFIGGKLLSNGREIDLVYNRLTDFYLGSPQNLMLRSAFIEGSVVLTPNPRHHALYADKRNLCALSDEATLLSLKVPERIIEILHASIPKTFLVKHNNSTDLWKRRNGFFFKPVMGYGSKGVYRGSKITRRVWENIINEEYIAQDYVLPSLRSVDDEIGILKVDFRNYTYYGDILHVIARMYQGQTTNFRTKSGGFAKVIMVDGDTNHDAFGNKGIHAKLNLF